LRSENAGFPTSRRVIGEHVSHPLIWTPRLLQAKFSQLMTPTEIKIAAIYPVS